MANATANPSRPRKGGEVEPKLASFIAVAGGALLGVAYSVEAAWLGAFAAVAAFAWLIERSSSAAFHGAAFGWSGYVGGFFWLQPALASFWDDRVALSWVVWIAWGAWVSLRFVVIALSYRLLRRGKAGVVVALVLPWVAVEWLYPSVFPFYLANPVIDLPWVPQAAALGGPLLVSAWVCAVGALLASGVIETPRFTWPPRSPWAAVLVGTVVLCAYGALSTAATEAEIREAPTRTVGVVQANVDVMKKRTARALSHRYHLDQSRSLLSETSVDLLIWPETSSLQPLPATLPISGAAVIAEPRVPLLFGGVRRDEAGRRFNSALLVGPDGMIRSAYDKRLLIPFAEVVPFGDVFEWWGRAAPTLSRFHPGASGARLTLGDVRIAAPICYETIRPAYVRALVRESDASLLVSLTNDGWFGDSPEPRIHLRLARFRAIEHRRFLVRATNTGISAIIDPLGRVVGATPLFEPATLIGQVALLDGHSLYRRVGAWPGALSVLALAFLAWTRRR